jgi:hypothetical protein
LQHALGKLTEDQGPRLRAARQAVGRALANLQDGDAGGVDAPDAAKGGWAS